MNPPRPLDGLEVLVLRPQGQAGAMANLLKAEGATPVIVSAVAIVPPADWSAVDAVLDDPSAFNWLVFSSVNGADLFLGRLAARGVPPEHIGTPVAAIGPATRARLEEGGVKVHWMPQEYTTQVLARELPLRSPQPAGSASARGRTPRVCVFRADIASSRMEEDLARRGFAVHRVDVYGTTPVNAEEIRRALATADVVALTSASIARAFAAAARGHLPSRVRVFSIGPATSEACRQIGIPVHAEASVHTVQGLVDALKNGRPAA